MYLILPLIYVVLGVFYGPIALWRRCKLHQDFKKFSPEELATLQHTSISQGKNGIQITSLIFTGLMLISIILAGIAAVGLSIGFVNSGIFDSISVLAIFGVTSLPLFVLGFNIPSVWNRRWVYLEELGLKEKVTLVRWYYGILLPTWVIGVAGSFVIAFNMIPQFS